jgi:hypothetical protein
VLLLDPVERLGGGESRPWFLSGAFPLWILFFLGWRIEELDRGFFFSLLLGFAMLKSMFGSTGPAAISGASRSAVPWCTGRKVAPVAIPAAAS